MSQHQITQFVFDRMSPSDEGCLTFTAKAAAEVRREFMRLAHTPEAEDAGRAVLQLIGLLDANREPHASGVLVKLLVDAVRALHRETNDDSFAAFADRLQDSLPTACSDSVPEGAFKARAFIPLPKVIR